MHPGSLAGSSPEPADLSSSSVKSYAGGRDDQQPVASARQGIQEAVTSRARRHRIIEHDDYRHARRGLVRAYLEQERERAREVGRRRMRIRVGIPPSLRAANNELTQLDKAWSPLAIASYREVTDAGAARLGILRLQTDRASLEAWPGVVARSASRQYSLHPGDMLCTREPAGACAFTQHSLERVMQRAGTGAVATQEIRAAAIVANSLLLSTGRRARVQAHHRARALRRVRGRVLAGAAVPEARHVPAHRRGRAPALRPADRTGRALWTGDRYHELLPAALYPEEPSALMDEVLEVYARHRAIALHARIARAKTGSSWRGDRDVPASPCRSRRSRWALR